MMFEIWRVLPKQVVAYLEWSKFKEWERSNDRREPQKNMETSVKSRTCNFLLNFVRCSDIIVLIS